MRIKISARQKKCQFFIKKLASYLHRTATTARPCYIPILGDSTGAGRIRLARGANVGEKSIQLLFEKKKSATAEYQNIGNSDRDVF